MHLPELIAAASSAPCGSCGQPSALKCAGCEAACFCSEDHQQTAWEEHRDRCQVYRVLRNDTVGRYGVATRTLQPGELVLTETPVVVGPKGSSPPLCLGCYVPVDCSVLCSRCSWPVCSADCETALCHAAECQVFSDARVKFQPVDDWAAPCPQLECITPLRLLLTKESNPDRWRNEVDFMEAHNEERKETEVWKLNQINTVEFLRKACKLSERFSEDEIHTACGLLDVNSFEVRSPSGNLVRGLYPQTAIMSHCCVANTSHSVVPVNELGEEYRLRLRASVRVERGGELFTSYSHSLESTMVRRRKLKLGKYFDCRCRRCLDPKELGTNMSTLKCSRCDNGVVVATNPLDENADWKCTHCEFTAHGDSVRQAIAIIQSQIDQLDYVDPSSADAIELREQLFRKYRSVLHPHHACMTALRYALVQLYGRVDGFLMDELPDVMLERKMQLCQDVLAVADVVEPGYTRLRAIVLYELHAALLMFTKSRFRYGELDAAGLKGKLVEAAKYLQEAVDILKLEDPATQEGMLARVGEESLQQLKASIENTEEVEKPPPFIKFNENNAA